LRDNLPVVSLIRTREQLEAQERTVLAPFAVPSSDAAREYPDPPPHERTHFQRDWHRITHSRAFRKLEYKTQVVVFGEGGEMGDVIRNRLTHTLEVSQVATSLCRALGLNEDLASAIALAHDLGHTPFGHSGEEALRELVKSFNHNDHSLKIVRQLEQRYPQFPGLNLTEHTLAGIEKHDTPFDKTHTKFFQRDLGPSLEAQVASVADEIAYHSHDVEDSLVTGYLSEMDYRSARLELWDEVEEGLAGHVLPVRMAQLTRRLIDVLARDVLAETARRIAAAGVASLDDVYRAQTVLVGFSQDMARRKGELRNFLFERFYKSHRVLRGTVKGQMIIKRLFHHFTEEFDRNTYGWMLLPPDVRANYRDAELKGRDALDRDPLRIIADFIAGMTDREAYSLYVKLFEVGA
jgi:dGTPase